MKSIEEIARLYLEISKKYNLKLEEVVDALAMAYREGQKDGMDTNH